MNEYETGTKDYSSELAAAGLLDQDEQQGILESRSESVIEILVNDSSLINQRQFDEALRKEIRIDRGTDHFDVTQNRVRIYLPGASYRDASNILDRIVPLLHEHLNPVNITHHPTGNSNPGYN